MAKANSTNLARRSAGLCTRCGGFQDRPSRTYCSVCAAFIRDLREGRRQNGKPGPKPCGLTPREQQAIRRNRLAEAGVCIRCNAPRDRGNRVECAACFDRCRILYREAKRAYWKRKSEAMKIANREKRQAWKAAGLCSLCGSDRQNPDFLLCTPCRERSLKRCRAQYRRRRAAGLCPKCGKVPPLPGKRSCADCIEAMKAAYRKAYLRDPEKFLARLHTRRTRKLGNGGSFTAAEWLTILRLQDYTCLCCGKREPDITLTVDHVIPVSLGGPSWAWNLQALCLSCNTSKGDNYLDLRPNGPWI